VHKREANQKLGSGKDLTHLSPLHCGRLLTAEPESPQGGIAMKQSPYFKNLGGQENEGLE